MFRLDKWTDILLSVKESKDSGNKSMLQIWRDKGIGYSHIHHCITEMEQRGWVSVEKEGRATITTLTKKGKIIKNLLVQINIIIQSK